MRLPVRGGGGWLPFLMLLLRPVPPTRGDYEDSCDFYAASIYCNCEFFRSQPGLGLDCYVRGSLTPEDPVWEKMGSRPATRLNLGCKRGWELPFLPRAALGALSRLRSFRLRQARLGTLPGDSFSRNPLVDLDLSSNEIGSLQPGAFRDMPGLRRISLTDNSLTRIENASFSRLPELRGLFLDGNAIAVIQGGSFRDLSGLSELILSGNNLTRLEAGVFAGLSRLDFLDLFRNRIGQLGEDVFLPLTGLLRLDLSRNRISSLPPHCFRGLKRLMVLQLDHNRLQTLPDRLFTPTPQLRQIGLDFNLLRTLPAYLLYDLERRTEEDFVFRFKDNPLRCDCGLWWVVRHHSNASRSQSWKKQLRHVECRASDSTSGGGARRVTKLTADEMGCGNDSAKYLIPPDPMDYARTEESWSDWEPGPASAAPAGVETDESNAGFSPRLQLSGAVLALLLAFR